MFKLEQMCVLAYIIIGFVDSHNINSRFKAIKGMESILKLYIKWLM